MTIKLGIGRENQADVKDLFGNTVQIGMRNDGAVLLAVRNDGKNTDNGNNVLDQDVIIALNPEQTKALAQELLRLQPYPTAPRAG